MAAGTGTAAFLGFTRETTKNTRIAPANFIPIMQESLSCEQDFIRSAGLGGGYRFTPRKGLGIKTVGGSVSWELQPETIIDLLELCLGGSASTSGSGPYVHVFEPGDLPSATLQVVRPTVGGTLTPFDYIGSMVNQWTISANPNEFATLQCEFFCYDELTDQSAATYSADASPTLLSFSNLTVDDVDSNEVCFDSITLTGTNALERSFKSCADDAGRAKIRENGRRTLTGTLSGDFEGLTAYASYLAGTEGSLQVEFDAGTNAKVVIDMNVFYTGETPNVDGPGVVKQGVPFEVLVGDGNDDTDALTVTVTSTDTNA